MRSFWLLKSEPEEFGIEDLRRQRGGRACWDGVRNYGARNLLRDRLRAGDGALFWHSSARRIGIAGEARVVRSGYPDPTQFDRRHPRFDRRSDPARPTWYSVDLRFVRACRGVIGPETLRSVRALKDMMVLRRGMRLSVQPVTASQWNAAMKLPAWRVKEGPE